MLLLHQIEYYTIINCMNIWTLLVYNKLLDISIVNALLLIKMLVLQLTYNK